MRTKIGEIKQWFSANADGSKAVIPAALGAIFSDRKYVDADEVFVKKHVTTKEEANHMVSNICGRLLESIAVSQVVVAGSLSHKLKLTC
ncbi:hypothetical protein [Parasitella parasitica]|uniref:Uncharacterized protein n=1 Tax=Parasitella parasitica TaxID=35722 RepID=A0A0B7N341_9FUNG|nr:hypothetical protein [Parasitella parasitica]